VGLGPIDADVNADFKDIVAELDRVIMLRGKADQEKWGLYLDYIYLRLDPDAGDLLLGEVDLRLTENILDFGTRLTITPNLDFLIGLRYLDVDARVDITPGLPLEPSRTRVSEDWVDPYLGLKYTWQLSPKWSIDLRGDVGGFNIFSGSDLAWLAEVQATHRPSDRWAWGFGYRHYDVDYEKGSGFNRFKYDITMAGLTLGIGVFF
jgi:hypothetical protein